DLIIIRGRNIYPQDIEQTVRDCHPLLARGGGAAAFSIEVSSEERLVIVHEVDGRKLADCDEVFSAVNSAMSATHEVQAHAIVLVKPGAVPRTSSGKTQRRLCRRMFLEGALDTVAVWTRAAAPVDEIQQELLWASLPVNGDRASAIAQDIRSILASNL